MENLATGGNAFNHFAVEATESVKKNAEASLVSRYASHTDSPKVLMAVVFSSVIIAVSGFMFSPFWASDWYFKIPLWQVDIPQSRQFDGWLEYSNPYLLWSTIWLLSAFALLCGTSLYLFFKKGTRGHVKGLIAKVILAYAMSVALCIVNPFPQVESNSLSSWANARYGISLVNTENPHGEVYEKTGSYSLTDEDGQLLVLKMDPTRDNRHFIYYDYGTKELPTAMKTRFVNSNGAEIKETVASILEDTIDDIFNHKSATGNQQNFR